MDQPLRFKLSTEYIELHQLLKAVGFCESGGVAKQAISYGMVKVDGTVEKAKGKKIRPGQSVEFEGRIVDVL